MSPLTVLAVCLVALAALQPAAALRCWQCDSSRDYFCEDPFRPYNQLASVACESMLEGGYPQPGYPQPGYPNTGYSPYGHGPLYPVCKKSKHRGQDGRYVINRSCAWINPNDGGRSACGLGQEYCSTCSTDNCNSAPRPNVPFAAILAAPLVAVAAWMRR